MSPPVDLVSAERLRTSYICHALVAQLYRLLPLEKGGTAVFERGMPSLSRPLAEVAQLGLELQLADCEIEPLGDDRWSFVAELLGGAGPLDLLTPLGSITGAMRQAGDVLPLLTELDFAGVVTPQPHSSIYPNRTGSRIRSLVHYFFALVEDPARNPTPFAEILASQFRLDYTTPPLHDLAAVQSWVTGRLASVVASEHAISRIDCSSRADGGLAAVVTMKSQALFPDSSGAISRNTQRWLVHDDPAERFARIESIAIERDAVEFFGPAPDYAPRAAPVLPS